ncbi:MAG: hypothetical protein ABI623_02485 [bacterium]
MKFLTTALLGALATLPLVFARKKSNQVLVPVKSEPRPNEREENLRYDVDDFLAQ